MPKAKAKPKKKSGPTPKTKHCTLELKQRLNVSLTYGLLRMLRHG